MLNFLNFSFIQKKYVVVIQLIVYIISLLIVVFNEELIRWLGGRRVAQDLGLELISSGGLAVYIFGFLIALTLYSIIDDSNKSFKAVNASIIFILLTTIFFGFDMMVETISYIVAIGFVLLILASGAANSSKNDGKGFMERGSDINNERDRKKVINKTCQYCSKSFNFVPMVSKYTTAVRYCSKKCADKDGSGKDYAKAWQINDAQKILDY